MMLSLDIIVLVGSNMNPGQLLPFWQIMHLILSYYIDTKKHTTEASFHRVEFTLRIDLAIYIFMTVHAEALPHDTDSLLYGVLLTQFLNAILVHEGLDEPKRYPFGPINKTTL